MARLIDGDKLLECYDGLDKYHVPVGAVKANINDMPTVDAMPVVFCRECKYNNACFTQSFVESEGVLPFDRNTWFCADGERKGGDE